MKNRALVYLFITAMFIAACVAPPEAPATEIIPTQPPPATSTPLLVPLAAEPTTTTIPLPLPVPPAAEATIPISIPVPGVNGSPLPLASPNSGTLNCRTGPGLGWAVTAIVNPGENVGIAGKSMDGLWWYVKQPAANTGFCWVFATFVTVSGNVSGVQIVGVDPAAATAEPTIISVSIGIEPNTVALGAGCPGPMPPLKVVVKIQTNGPRTIRIHFEDLQTNNVFSTQKRVFDRADIKDVESFYTPPLVAGTYKIALHVDDIDLSGLGANATYTITC